MPGINFYELLILIGMAVVLLGPERIPQYARKLADWVRKARGMAENAKVRFKDETGTEFDSVDWQRYDPRQYDPRRIIREALAEDYQDVRDSAADLKRSVDPRELFRSSGGQGGSAIAAGVAGAAGTAARSTPAEAADPQHSVAGGHPDLDAQGGDETGNTPGFMNASGFSLNAAPYDVDAT